LVPIEQEFQESLDTLENEEDDNQNLKKEESAKWTKTEEKRSQENQEVMTAIKNKAVAGIQQRIKVDFNSEGEDDDVEVSVVETASSIGASSSASVRRRKSTKDAFFQQMQDSRKSLQKQADDRLELSMIQAQNDAARIKTDADRLAFEKEKYIIETKESGQSVLTAMAPEGFE